MKASNFNSKLSVSKSVVSRFNNENMSLMTGSIIVHNNMTGSIIVHNMTGSIIVH
jgi:hypothetical protein